MGAVLDFFILWLDCFLLALPPFMADCCDSVSDLITCCSTKFMISASSASDSFLCWRSATSFWESFLLFLRSIKFFLATSSLSEKSSLSSALPERFLLFLPWLDNFFTWGAKSLILMDVPYFIKPASLVAISLMAIMSLNGSVY